MAAIQHQLQGVLQHVENVGPARIQHLMGGLSMGWCMLMPPTASTDTHEHSAANHQLVNIQQWVMVLPRGVGTDACISQDKHCPGIDRGAT